MQAHKLSKIQLNALVARKYIEKMQNAKNRGVEFDLTLTSMKNLVKAKRCYYTGVELTVGTGLPTDMSIDRVDNSLGYVKGNVVACCQGANRIKGLMEKGGYSEIMIAKKIADATTSRLKKKANIAEHIKGMWTPNISVSDTNHYTYGTITVLKQGYGFIEYEDEVSDSLTSVYFHNVNLEGVSFLDLCEGDSVTFKLGTNARGKCACNVKVVD